MISAVSAKDITIGPKTPGGLQEAIDKAESGDTIYLKNGVYTVDGKEIQIGKLYSGVFDGKYLPKKISIVGRGSNAVIDGKKRTIFQVDQANRHLSLPSGYIIKNSSLTLENIKLKNGGYWSSADGDPSGTNNPAIIGCGGTVTFKNCTFSNNRFVLVNMGTTIVKNCVFNGNYRSISSSSSFISNSKFINGGGDSGKYLNNIVVSMGIGTVNKCVFTNNIGGDCISGFISGQRTGSRISVDRCTFTKNRPYGSCIVGENLTVKNSVFKNNYQESITVSSGGKLNCNRCTFTNNKNIAITCFSNSKITNSKFIKNLLKDYAPVRNGGNMTVNNCKFADNAVKYQLRLTAGGITTGGRGVLRISNTQFKNNIVGNKYMSIFNDNILPGKVIRKNVKITPKEGTIVKKTKK